MPNPVLALIEKHAGADFIPRAKRLAVGLAHDFWKDGTDNPFKRIAAPPKPEASIVPRRKTAQERIQAVQDSHLWHAAPGEVSEKMWGEGSVTPCDEAIIDALITPLGLNKDTAVLDLSAGLGGRLRKTSEKFGIYITGLEPDQQIAQRGMEMSVRAGKGKRSPVEYYDPQNFSMAKKFDCIVARETFYRVVDKEKFFTTIAGCTKAHAQIAYTDYIVDPENRDKPAILKWQQFEAGAAPLSLIETAEAWAKVGFTIRIHEDMTDFYKKEVLKGLERLAKYLSSGVKPAPETKKVIAKRIETWAHRLAAIEQGMKFYRFYGIK